MRRFFLLSLALAGFGAGAAPAAAYSPFHAWDFCTANSFSVCMNFSLLRDGATNDYELSVTYVSTVAPVGEEGAMTAVGLFRRMQAPDVNVTNAVVFSTSPAVSWTIGNSNQLSGNGAIVLEVDAHSNQGITNGLPVGGSVTIRFSSNNLASYDVDGDLFARAHIQGFGPNSCSLKPDSDAPGNLVGTPASVDDDCGTPITTTPEPVTMVLLGSGLLGVGAAERRRRRRRDAESV